MLHRAQKQKSCFCAATITYMKKCNNKLRLQSGSRTEPEPEFYKLVLRYFCQTLTGTEPNNVSTCEP